MVEFSEVNVPKGLTQVLDRMLNAGITPVVTHPERNALLMSDLERLVEWIQAGCLLQVTAQSFLGRFGKSAGKAAADLMARRMVHFVASDAHDTLHRPPDLNPAYDFVCEHYGVELAKRVFETNPAATLQGGDIYFEPPESTAPRRKWFFF